MRYTDIIWGRSKLNIRLIRLWIVVDDDFMIILTTRYWVIVLANELSSQQIALCIINVLLKHWLVPCMSLKC